MADHLRLALSLTGVCSFQEAARRHQRQAAAVSGEVPSPVATEAEERPQGRLLSAVGGATAAPLPPADISLSCPLLCVGFSRRAVARDGTGRDVHVCCLPASLPVAAERRRHALSVRYCVSRPLGGPLPGSAPDKWPALAAPARPTKCSEHACAGRARCLVAAARCVTVCRARRAALLCFS